METKVAGALRGHEYIARILPTRNGNQDYPHVDVQMFSLGEHGSYLQGMETFFSTLLTAFLSTLHGSYLQGMETPQVGDGRPLTPKQEKRTDPTYKEWKQPRLYYPLLLLLGTDPTYKEWKHQTSLLFPSPPSRSTDPTYKEWKRSSSKRASLYCPARILPTRNGNRSISLWARLKLRARILPTRNGNCLRTHQVV